MKIKDYMLINVGKTEPNRISSGCIPIPPKNIVDYLNDGWELYGHPIAINGCAYQAIIKPESNQKEEKEKYQDALDYMKRTKTNQEDITISWDVVRLGIEMERR